MADNARSIARSFRLALAWIGVTRETGKLAEVPGCAVQWRVTARCCGVARQSGVVLMLPGLKDGVVVVSVVCEAVYTVFVTE